MEQVYCEHCCVVEINPGDKYCVGCAQDVTDWLYDAEMDKQAEMATEQIAIEGGLY
jgi:hypothetical protein